MDAQTVLEEWEVSPFDGGFDGLRELRSRRFSGAVEAGTAWLFFRDGEPLAVVDDLETEPRSGDVDAFEGASGRLHEAPHPGAASLAAMLALDGDVRGQYFTEDTPLSTVHGTLSEGGFTGYVELAENVLSGDYYVVYEDGAEAYLGVLGSSQRLITGEEAQSKAEGEVGIYSVVAVDYPDVELPEPEPEPEPDPDPEPSTGAPTPESDPVESDGAAEPDEPAVNGAGPSGDSESAAGPEPDTDIDPEPREADREPVPEPDPDPDPTPAPDPGPSVESEPNRESATGSEPDRDGGGQPESEPGRSEREPTPEPGPADRDQPAEEPSPSAETHSTPEASGSSGAAESTDEAVLDGVTSRAVPSLDPENSGRADAGAGSAEPREPASEPEPEPEPASEPEPEPERRIAEVREEYESRIEDLRAELDALREERDGLRDRVETLESRESTGADGPSLSPAEALAGTSLFVREATRGEATLEDAHAGRADRETLDENLDIEYHTQFEDEAATVEGEPFEAWLRSSALYEFVEWLIVDLLFEIQSTDSEAQMRHVYDAIPDIDRVGFDDPVTVGDGQEGREISFDVVARNRMGEPLVIAEVDRSRDPTSAGAMRPLINDAEDVCGDHETLAGTFAVTSSFFEPDALDAAREATSGSLLSREKYRSYVKLTRKNGFHLCLVESRDGSFHLTVPEL